MRPSFASAPLRVEFHDISIPKALLMAGTYSKLLFHLVFSTKNRIPFISPKWAEELYQYLGGILRSENGVLIEIGGTEDHLHMLVQLKPTHLLSDLLRTIKACSSKWVNEQKLKLRKFGWQEGYSAFTVSESQADRVVAYIRSQKEHHKKSDFKSEFVSLLEKHGVEYKEKYLW